MIWCCSARPSDFNPRSRTGSDAPRGIFGGQRRDISIHAPAQGATGRSVAGGASSLFQSTLPHRERRIRYVNISHCSGMISIHAPAQGATITKNSEEQRKRISIHAPAQGATRAAGTAACGKKYFNPRSRTGSDSPLTSPGRWHRRFQSTLPHRERRYRFIRCYSRYNISIHAPAQGATLPGKLR